MNRFEDAANAALTVLSVQPEHQIMKDNLNYYIKVGSVDPDNVSNLEMKVSFINFLKFIKVFLKISISQQRQK